MFISNHLANGVENLEKMTPAKSSDFASLFNKVTKVSLNQPGKRRKLKKGHLIPLLKRFEVRSLKESAQFESLLFSSKPLQNKVKVWIKI